MIDISNPDSWWEIPWIAYFVSLYKDSDFQVHTYHFQTKILLVKFLIKVYNL